MSHFTVLVIGDNVDKQLAPYHEFECTGMNDEYVKDYDITEEAKKEYEKYRNDYKSLAEFVEEEYGSKRVGNDGINRNGEHKYGYYLVNKECEVVQVFDRTNKNKKWDWYQIGGRWTGYFKVKDGVKKYNVGSPGIMTDPAKDGYADQILKKDVDWEGMRANYIVKAEERWNKMQDAIAENDLNENYEENFNNLNEHDRNRFESMCEQNMLEKTLDTYRLWCLNGVTYWRFGYDILTGGTKEEYIGDQCSFSTYAVVKDGEWYAKGEMGWWGMSCDVNDKYEWNRKFNELLESISGDTLLTIVDCHI